MTRPHPDAPMTPDARPAPRRRPAGRLLPALIAATLLGLVAPDADAGAQRRPGALVVGVLPLGAAAGDTLLVARGDGLADLLATDLARSGRLAVVERARLAAILRELDLAAAGAVDSATAPRAGRRLQARSLVAGSLDRRPDGEIVFAIRIDDVATGRVDTALVRRASLNDILEAEKQLAFAVFEHFGVQLTPQERALVEQRPTRDLSALLAYGQGVQAEVNGQYAAAARAFRRAAAADPAFAAARTRLQDVRGTLRLSLASSLLDHVNRPLETTTPTTTVTPRTGRASDPAFPSTQGTIIIRITRP